MRWQDLKDLFRTDSTPLHASVALDNQGRSRGYGVVRFAGMDEAMAAVAEMNGATVSGRVLSVRLDKFAGELEEQMEEMAL
jgi:RNA recognition motif-containing protein